MQVAPFDYATSRAEAGIENQNVSRADARLSGARSRPPPSDKAWRRPEPKTDQLENALNRDVTHGKEGTSSKTRKGPLF